MDCDSSPATPHRPHPDVVSRRLGDEVVLVHLGTNQIFELNATGARVWELLAEACPPDQIGPILSSEFQVDARQAQHEVKRLLGELRTAGLLTS